MATFTAAEGDGAPASPVAGSHAVHGVWLVRVRGEIDVENVEPLRHAVQAALRGHRGPLVFDLAEVSFCDSQLVNVVLAVAGQRPAGMVRPSHRVRRLMELSGVSAVVPVFGSVREAASRLVPGDGAGPAGPEDGAAPNTR